MEALTIDFGKDYNEQSEKAKSMISEHDYYEVQNLMELRNQLRNKNKTDVTETRNVPQPIDVNKTIGMIKDWSDDLRNRFYDGKANWIAMIENSDTKNLEMQVICGNRNKPITMKCGNFPKEEIIAYIEEIYAKGGYISRIDM